MNHERTEQLRKLGKAAERFRMLAASPMKRTLHAAGIIVQAPENVNLFLLAEGIGLAGGDGMLLVDELDRTRKALADLMELHEDEPNRPAVRNARQMLEGTHEHTAGLMRLRYLIPNHKKLGPFLQGPELRVVSICGIRACVNYIRLRRAGVFATSEERR